MSHPKQVQTPPAHTIRTFEYLASTPARLDLLTIAEAGYAAIRTDAVMRREVVRSGTTLTIHGTPYDLTRYEHLYVLGVGKCAVDAAETLEALLGDLISDGAILDVRTSATLTRIRSYEGTHPYPSAQNAAHTAALLALAERATERDLVLVIVSGGGSALLTQPVTHTCVEEANLVRHLFKGGATIEELNVVRKHLSRARGGHFAAAAYPAEVVALLFSDVPGDAIHTIASGPTVRDETLRKDACAVLEKYHGERAGFRPEHLIDTPKDPKLFARVRNELVLTNITALEAMRDTASALGYAAYIRDTRLIGEARKVGALIAGELHAAHPRTVLLYGGETTVTIRGTGTGGRNEELTLAALEELMPDELVLSFASDGRDNTDYAGGIADALTSACAATQGLQARTYLDANDSFSFFHTLQQGVETGYTGANVADLVIAMKHERP